MFGRQQVALLGVIVLVAGCFGSLSVSASRPRPNVALREPTQQVLGLQLVNIRDQFVVPPKRGIREVSVDG